jgi:pimeloyl-ACP methyl ester carboxylesterase
VLGAERPSCRSADLPPGFRAEDVTLRASDGIALEAYFLPAPGRPAVLLLHGNGNCKADMAKYARFLRPAGYAVLAFDFRGQGNSEGTRVTYGREELRDVRAALDFLEAASYDSIALIGTSLGGGIAILAGARFDDVDAVVADAAFSDVEGVVRHQARRRGLGLPPLAMSALMSLVRFDATLRYRSNYLPCDPVDVVGEIAPRPLLIVHGDRDTYIPVSQARRNAREAGVGSEFWILEGHSHSAFIWGHVPRYPERVLRFLGNALD